MGEDQAWLHEAHQQQGKEEGPHYSQTLRLHIGTLSLVFAVSHVLAEHAGEGEVKTCGREEQRHNCPDHQQPARLPFTRVPTHHRNDAKQWRPRPR